VYSWLKPLQKNLKKRRFEPRQVDALLGEWSRVSLKS